MGITANEQNTLRTQLVDKLKVLVAREEKIDAHLRQPGDADWSEQAREREGDMVLEALDDHDRRDIAAIRAALDRMDTGVYGVCVSCEEDIPLGRLKVLPFATRCVQCAA